MKFSLFKSFSKILILAGSAALVYLVVTMVSPSYFKSDMAEAQLPGCTLLTHIDPAGLAFTETPLTYSNPASTAPNSANTYVGKVTVPPECIDSICTIVMTKVLVTPSGEVTEVLRTMNYIQQSTPAGPIGSFQNNLRRWSKPGDNDGVNCAAGANGTIQLSGTCNQLISVLNNPKIDLHDDFSVNTMNSSGAELTNNQWMIRDADPTRIARLYLCN